MAPDAAAGHEAGSPAPRSERPDLRTSDPSVMRALAHPLRMEILDILDDLDEATASEVAERTGQTVANCSFHLRSLEKAGFVERGAPRGREKPWRPAHRNRDLRPDPTDLDSVTQAGAVGSVVVQREAARVVDVLSRGALSDPEWIDAVTITTSRFWASAEEMKALALELQRITDRFAGRGDDPSKRPEGARVGRLFVTLNPEPDDAARGGQA
ncbi:transcriptional regulator, ArsR family [Beutenbergia cavernae DSM 12333]|uniref:Transcriptional regulator, ArsR family n=1 Tax=Beutenbergia cavernae (strain ATCC BAA-8 / DSM 12333 / CCUG 43141 / JCM 11478 / NBRC 16432 / NCIMB 13614 / HKI 0122) TaxID=471853 RepID=C5C168_BEUC1|nr:winged helix-turn-helix domain-containing protein [Beutenbergia cavernae]ACQ79472.1 transcriptional regulator, ArsR family [Beutenbergia cavernae DSM 12333]